MARGYRVQTRMEKSVIKHDGVSIAPGGNLIYNWTLEGGDEECQIKRMVLSANVTGSSTASLTFEWGLFQEPNPAAGDFTNETSIAAFVAGSGVLLDRTTTIRVPRGWEIGLIVTNPTPNALQFQAISLLHYKVLS